MKFWNIFLELCNNVGKSPNAVAKELGISSAAITTWKSKPERTPQDRMLLKIADYFGVTVDYLLGKEDKKETPPGDELAEGEKMLLELFRQVPEEQQQLVLQMIKAAIKS